MWKTEYATVPVGDGVLEIQLTTETARMPTRGTEEAAGLDLYVDGAHTIPPGQLLKLPTGVRVALPKETAGVMTQRSSAFLRGLFVQGLIDSDYRGEIFIMCRNLNTSPIEVEHGARIAQMVVIPYEKVQIRQSFDLDRTARGEAGFGSTGK